MARIFIFRKGDKICYATADRQRPLQLSKMKEKLIKLGWEVEGQFGGRNLIGYGIPTMTEVLKRLP